MMNKQKGGSVIGKIGKVLKDVNKVAKKTKILSTALSAIPNATAQSIGAVAKSAGYGRKRKRRVGRRRKVGGMHGRGERLGDSVLGIGYQISHPVF